MSDLRKVIAYLKKKKYVIYKDPYKLNIVGVRSSKLPNRYDDKMFVWYYDDKNKLINYEYPITTDPGTYFLLNPINKLGTACLKAAQYINTYSLGYHRGKYLALVQTKPVTVWRDPDRNSSFAFKKTSTGLYGINIHKGGGELVNNWSAGCQVFKNTSDFNSFIKLCEKQKSLYGNKFTYTLIDQIQINKLRKKRNFLVFSGLSSVILYTIIKNDLFNKVFKR